MANKPFGILSPTYGIKQDFPSILLKDAYLPDALDDIKNIWFVDGEIQSVRKRTQEFAQTLPDHILFWEQFWKKDQSFFMVGATKRDIFYRDSTNNRMQYLTPKYNTGLAQFTNGDATVVGSGGADFTNLKAGDFITIGTTYSTADTWYVVSSVTDATHLELTAVYAGTTTAAVAYQARKTYTGTATDWWEAVTYDDQFIMTNGVDNMQAWGGTNQFAVLGGSPPKLKHIVVYENYIVGGGTSSEPYTYFWCALGDETNWSTGDSGSAELDDYYVINKAAKLGGFLILLTERTLEKIWLVGGDLVFNRKRITDDCGAWAPRSVVITNSALYFYAADNTFRCYTGMTWESVSDVFKKYIKDINPEYEKSITGTYIEEHEVILWAIPNATSTGRNNQVVVYDLKAPIEIDNWSKFDMEVLAFGFYEVEDSVTWDTWEFTTWDSITWDKWDTRTGTEGAPRELCTDYSGDTFRLFASETDDGAAYDRMFVLATDLTENKRGMNYVKRLTKMRCIFRNEDAGTVDVYIKRDYESSWQSIGSISLDGTEEFLFLDVYPNYTAKNFLIKFSAQNRFRFLGIIFDEDSFEILGSR